MSSHTCVFCGRSHDDTYTIPNPSTGAPVRLHRKICETCVPRKGSVFNVRRPIISGDALAREIVELMEHYFNSEGFSAPANPPPYLVGTCRSLAQRGLTTSTSDILSFIVGEDGAHIIHPISSQEMEKSEKNLAKAIQRFSDESL